jgi:hypothetical protein
MLPDGKGNMAGRVIAEICRRVDGDDGPRSGGGWQTMRYALYRNVGGRGCVDFLGTVDADNEDEADQFARRTYDWEPADVLSVEVDNEDV